jgi:hypothetical protein
VNKPASSTRQRVAAGIVYWAVMSIIYSSILVAILNNYKLTQLQVITDTVVTNILITASCVLILHNLRFYLPRQEKYWYVLTISLGLSCLTYFLAKGILWLCFKNDLNYLSSIDQTNAIRFGISFLVIGCFSMLSLLLFTHEEQQSVIKRKDEMEKLAKEAELFRLRQQLQPHFLFNSLNSISALTGSQPEKARHMIEQLSDFLRGTLKKDDQQWSTLQEELQYLKLYLDIEKVRFGYRLQTDIDCTDEAKMMKIPALLLQPVVENAIKFGLYDTTGDVVISITASEENGALKISIQNPFDAETSSLRGTGFGLASIQRRLFLLFGRHDLLVTRQHKVFFITDILIPQ